MDKILLGAMLAASAIDVGTTEYALSQPGIHEVNPLMGSRGVRVTVNVAVPIVIWRMTRNKPVKQQLAFTLPYIGVKSWAGYHNYRLATEAER